MTHLLSVCKQEEVVDSSLEFLILASDGLWDVVTNEVNTPLILLPPELTSQLARSKILI